MPVPRVATSTTPPAALPRDHECLGEAKTLQAPEIWHLASGDPAKAFVSIRVGLVIQNSIDDHSGAAARHGFSSSIRQAGSMVSAAWLLGQHGSSWQRPG